jgi:hypothetical protein
MSTRFPSHTVAPAKKEDFATEWKILKPRLVDTVLLGMVLVSVVGLIYAWLH